MCSEPSLRGDCEENIPAFYFNYERSACEPFYYSGCGGNDNRFDTAAQCEQRCGRQG